MVFGFKYEVAIVAKAHNNIITKWHEKLAHQNFGNVRKLLYKNNINAKQTPIQNWEKLFGRKDTLLIIW